MESRKAGFVTYVGERLAGYEPRATAPRGEPVGGVERGHGFPGVLRGGIPDGAGASIGTPTSLACTGPIAYKGQQALQRDTENVKAALKGVNAEEAFMPPGPRMSRRSVSKNEYYPTEEAYLYAIADAMREEYNAIVTAGFLLQVDDPRLVTYYNSNPGSTVEQCRKWAELRVEALNYALRDIPPEKVRFHTCYGINIGPRVHDMALTDIVAIMLRVNAGAYSFEAANPRHEHEWRVWQSVKLPEGKILIPRVITHCSNICEHPELVAERLLQFAGIVGRENIIAGSDCGFSSQATAEPEIHPTVVWAKFKAMAEGARLASEELWGRR